MCRRWYHLEGASQCAPQGASRNEPQPVRRCERAADELRRRRRSTIETSTRCYMATYIRVISAIASILMLAACAATAPKPTAAAGVGAAVPNRACLTQTGSLIAVHGTKCSEIGLSVSSDDVRRYGVTTAAEALRFSVPSITINH